MVTTIHRGLNVVASAAALATLGLGAQACAVPLDASFRPVFGKTSITSAEVASSESPPIRRLEATAAGPPPRARRDKTLGGDVALIAVGGVAAIVSAPLIYGAYTGMEGTSCANNNTPNFPDGSRRTPPRIRRSRRKNTMR